MSTPGNDCVAECYRQLRRLVDKKFSFAKRVTKLPTTQEEQALPLHVKPVPTISWSKLWRAAGKLPTDAREELRSAFQWTWDAALYAHLAQQDSTVLSDVSDDDISLMLHTGIISPQSEPKSLGRAFTVVELKEKPDGELQKRRRPILWPRAVNLGLKGSTNVALPNVEEQLKQIAGATTETHACSFDLKTSFFQIPLSPEVARYFSFRLKDGRTFSYNVLPMGFVNSVKVMQTLLVTLGLLCRLAAPEVSFCAYVDNIRFVGTSIGCQRAADVMQETCRECSISLNVEEGNVPHREGVFLGIKYHFCEDGADLSLPPIQAGKIRRDKKRFEDKKLTVEVFEQLVGRLFWGSSVILPNLSQFYYPIKFIRKTSSDTTHERIGPFDILPIPPSIRIVFEQWFKQLLLNSPRHINQMGVPHLFLATDAADHGWGAVLIFEDTGDVLTAGGPWTKMEKAKEIKERETLAVMRAADRFATYLKGQDVSLLVDNTTTIGALERQRSPNFFLNKAVLLTLPKLSEWRARTIHYIKSAENPADEISRGVAMDNKKVVAITGKQPNFVMQLREWGSDLDDVILNPAKLNRCQSSG